METLQSCNNNKYQAQLTLHNEVDAFVKRLRLRADSLERKCTSRKSKTWQARGSQKMMRRVSTYVRAMWTRFESSPVLAIALREYLDCLEKSKGE
jgi:hypothetical protein